MSLQEQLRTLSLQVQGDTDYHHMLQALIGEMQEKTQVIMALNEEKNVMAEWSAFLESFSEIISKWGGSDKAWLKKKKLYVEMEDLMAEIDDWIDELNESVLSKDKQLAYMETWDIGIFFDE